MFVVCFVILLVAVLGWLPRALFVFAVVSLSVLAAWMLSFWLCICVFTRMFAGMFYCSSAACFRVCVVARVRACVLVDLSYCVVCSFVCDPPLTCVWLRICRVMLS